MARRPPTREWRDDIPRSFRYTPPAEATPAPTPVRTQRVLRLVVGLLFQR